MLEHGNFTPVAHNFLLLLELLVVLILTDFHPDGENFLLEPIDFHVLFGYLFVQGNDLVT